MKKGLLIAVGLALAFLGTILKGAANENNPRLGYLGILCVAAGAGVIYTSFASPSDKRKQEKKDLTKKDSEYL